MEQMLLLPDIDAQVQKEAGRWQGANRQLHLAQIGLQAPLGGMGGGIPTRELRGDVANVGEKLADLPELPRRHSGSPCLVIVLYLLALSWWPERGVRRRAAGLTG